MAPQTSQQGSATSERCDAATRATPSRAGEDALGVFAELCCVQPGPPAALLLAGRGAVGGSVSGLVWSGGRRRGRGRQGVVCWIISEPGMCGFLGGFLHSGMRGRAAADSRASDVGRVWPNPAQAGPHAAGVDPTSIRFGALCTISVNLWAGSPERGPSSFKTQTFEHLPQQGEDRLRACERRERGMSAALDRNDHQSALLVKLRAGHPESDEGIDFDTTRSDSHTSLWGSLVSNSW